MRQCGAGLDALVCKKALKSKVKDALNKLHLGKLTYLFLTVQSLFTMQTTDAAAVFDGKGQQNRKKMIFAAAMNFRAEGGGVPMAPGGRCAGWKAFGVYGVGNPEMAHFFMPAIACDSQSSADQRV